MEILELKQKVENLALNVNSQLHNIIDLNINDSLVNKICSYAIDNICNTRDRAFFIKCISDICKVNCDSISCFLNASELLIIAIYIKDDIIDDNSFRGGKKSLHLEFGLDMAILISDIFYSLSIKEVQKANEFLQPDKLERIIKLHIDCYQNVCFGQIIGCTLPKESYKSEIIMSHYKSLVGETYEYFSELPLSMKENIDYLKIKRFAQLCGIASQLQNDFEDIAGDKEVIETELLMDILYGRPNYIISLLFEELSLLNKNQIALLSSLFGCKNKEIVTEEKRDLLFKLIVDSSVLDSALNSLVNVCDEAISILYQLRDCEGKTNLIKYMKYLKYE